MRTPPRSAHRGFANRVQKFKAGGDPGRTVESSEACVFKGQDCRNRAAFLLPIPVRTASSPAKEKKAVAELQNEPLSYFVPLQRKYLGIVPSILYFVSVV